MLSFFTSHIGLVALFLISLVILGRFLVSLSLARQIMHARRLDPFTDLLYRGQILPENFRVLHSSVVPLWKRSIYQIFGKSVARFVSAAGDGTGLNFRGAHVFQIGLTFGAVATITATEQSMVVPTLPGQIPLAQCAVFGSRLGAPQAGACIAHCRVIDSTHIGVTWVNPTAGGVTPTAGETFTFALVW